MRLIGIQLDIAWEDAAANYASVRRILARANPAPGDMVVLPEMFASGFTMNLAAADHPEATERFLSQLVVDYKIYLIAGVVTRASPDRGRNQALIIGPDGKQIARYCKLNPFM